jgi:hypothetical protein
VRCAAYPSWIWKHLATKSLPKKTKQILAFLLHGYGLGGVCHSAGEEDAYHALCELVREEVSALLKGGKPLPAPGTRPMREAVLT